MLLPLALMSTQGMTRDVLCGLPPRILHNHQEPYAPVAFAAAATHLSLRALRLPVGARVAIVLAGTTAVRTLLYESDAKLPSWEAPATVRPQRQPPQRPTDDSKT